MSTTTETSTPRLGQRLVPILQHIHQTEQRILQLNLIVDHAEVKTDVLSMYIEIGSQRILLEMDVDMVLERVSQSIDLNRLILDSLRREMLGVLQGASS